MRRDWTCNELVVVFNLYCKIPFAKTKATNPAVIEIARIIGRTPAAVAMKLGNFGSFDPALRAKGISGLSRASKTDREIWSEFNPAGIPHLGGWGWEQGAAKRLMRSMK